MIHYLRLGSVPPKHHVTHRENGKLLKEELAQVFYEAEVDAIYRLLWGFGREDAHNREISQQLIDWMGHDQIAIRELAFYHVRRLTDGRSRMGYRPNLPAKQRQSGIYNWQKVVDKNAGLLPKPK